MNYLTKAQSRKLLDLRLCIFETGGKIFDVMPGSDNSFMTCYAAAPMPIRMDLEMALVNLQAFERAMISEGRGHLDSRGNFQAYSSRGR